MKNWTLMEWIFVGGLCCIALALLLGRYWLAAYVFAGLVCIEGLFFLMIVASADDHFPEED